MALDPGSGRRSISPESSGRDSPIPPQWRSQIGSEEPKIKDKNYKRYAAGVDKVLALFDTALEEWADYISFLNKLLKALQTRPTSITRVPASPTVAKRLSQCLDPSLPSGVHQKALEVYGYIFSILGKDGLSRDLPVWLPGLSSTLSFASLSVRSPFLDILEDHFLQIDPRSLRPALRSIILALLPGLEEETSEDFERTLKLLNRFKEAIRPDDSGLLTDDHSTGDQFFWQCFFLASITGQSRRAGALAYLMRYLPMLGAGKAQQSRKDSAFHEQLAAMVTSPEPGLLIRCFATGLHDEQLLIQRGFLDLLVTHLPLDSSVLQDRIKDSDLQLLVKAAIGVVIRREMSLNRRLWAWFLGPEPVAAEADHAPESPTTTSDPTHGIPNSRTSFFEEFGLQTLVKTLLAMIQDSGSGTAADRARPYRICLSLMDRWEIGGLVVPEVFLPVVDNVRQFKTQARSKVEFVEVLRSASVFFDGIESGLIYGEIVSLVAQAIGPGVATMAERRDRLDLVLFILEHFNVREEEMITVHAPLSCLTTMAMLEDHVSRQSPQHPLVGDAAFLQEQSLKVATALLELVPERAFASRSQEHDHPNRRKLPPNTELLKKARSFYVHEQGNTEASSIPFASWEIGEILLDKCVRFIRGDLKGQSSIDLPSIIRFFLLVLFKAPEDYSFDRQALLSFLHDRMVSQIEVPFPEYSSVVHLVTQMHTLGRITMDQLSDLVLPLVRHAWAFLTASEPKYHVEVVRCMWYLQTSLSAASREVEAALSTLIVEAKSPVSGSADAIDIGRTFGILWSHTLQDSTTDRRGSKTPLSEYRTSTRLSGMEHFEVMLTQPLFLVLDSLLDERTQLFMTIKSWLNSMIGIDRLFLILVTKFLQMRFLSQVEAESAGQDMYKPAAIQFSEEDDLELCLYYLRTLSNILRCSSEVSWSVVATKHLSFAHDVAQISAGNNDGDITLQDFFVRVCMRCIIGDAPPSASSELVDRISELQRFALSTLHIFLSGRFASSFSSLHLENILISRLASSITNSDPYVQVLLLEVVHDALELRDMPMPETPSSPAEKRPGSIDPTRSGRASIALSESLPTKSPPPPQLLKCLQSGLSSSQSRLVLDSWIKFLGQCLPFYSNTIFQVVIPLVETFCKQISFAFSSLKDTFRVSRDSANVTAGSPESTLIHLLNGLEQVLAAAHEQLLSVEARAQLLKTPDQPQSIFGSMVSGVWQSDSPQTRSATANDRLTVHLAFQDAVRMCYNIWCWGQGDDALQQDPVSSASFGYTSLRMRNRARRLLEHLFHAEPLECLETIIDMWNKPDTHSAKSQVFNLLSALDGSRPRHTVPALFNAIYSRTNPSALEPWRKSTLTISLEDTELVLFLVEYARSLDDDAMDEIWTDCITFIRDILSNPFPHRRTLPRLLEFAAILGEKVDNTNFGEQRKMRRELGDLFLRLLTALFTTRPMSFTDSANGTTEKSSRATPNIGDGDDQQDVVSILAEVVPELSKVLVDHDRVLSAAGTISASVIGPTIRAKSFPDTVSLGTLKLLHELSRLQNNQKTWKRDVGDAFNDSRFFSMNLALVKEHWLPLLRLWTRSDKEKLPEIVARINPPTTAGIVFGVGATSARLEADRKTQVNLRRIATVILSAAEDTFVADLPLIVEKLVELLTATATSSPSSTTRADVYMVMRAVVLRTSPVHLATLWPVVNSEIHAAISSVVAPDHSPASDMYNNATVLQACKLLDLLICVAPDDFQLHEWLFITDTIDAIYRSHKYQPVSLVDELSEELGKSTGVPASATIIDAGALVAGSSHKRPLLGPGGISDDVSLERRDELVARILRPFFSQLSIFAFESTYAMVPLDKELCLDLLLKDIFEEKTIVKAL